MSSKLLIYLHGFRSSPLSFKSQLIHNLAKREGIAFWCPKLPASPSQALSLIEHEVSQIDHEKEILLIGSSLGGFYASVLLERYPERYRRALLLNPGIHPAKDLEKYVGRLTAWHDPTEEFDFKVEYIEQLKSLELELRVNDPKRYSLLICKGDEIIDWRDMVGRYQDGAVMKIIEGGDHAITDFETHLPFVKEFARN
jgi:predicted esterase YcpF (UPF0227 family)